MVRAWGGSDAVTSAYSPAKSGLHGLATQRRMDKRRDSERQRGSRRVAGPRRFAAIAAVLYGGRQ